MSLKLQAAPGENGPDGHLYDVGGSSLTDDMMPGGRASYDLYDDQRLLVSYIGHLVSPQEAEEVAAALLQRFGCLARVLCARIGTLKKVCGEALSVQIKLLETAIQHRYRNRVIGQDISSGWLDLLTFLNVSLAHSEVESLYLIHLDHDHRIFLDERVASGTIDRVAIYPREIVIRALDESTSSIILVHNHPSGDTSPSAADISQTKVVENALGAVGVSLYDHIVIGHIAPFSFRAAGLLDGEKYV